MRIRSKFMVLLSGVAAVLLIACNGDEPAPTPAPAAAPPAAVAGAAAPATAPAVVVEPVADPAPVAPEPAAPAPQTSEPAPAATPATLEPAPAPEPAPEPAPAGPLDGIAVPDPYEPNDRDSILDRYVADKSRFEAVLATDSPVLWVTDAIWCPKCGAVRPHVRELMDEYAGRVHFLIMDYDDPGLDSYRREFNAGNHPSLAGVRGGVAALSHQGVAGKDQIVALIEAAIVG